jgi:hypothetical protein
MSSWWGEEEQRLFERADPETAEAFEGLPSIPRSTATGDLLDAVLAALVRFVLFANEHQGVFCALWVMHTHAFGAAVTTPYVHVRSATRRSGKSRLFEVSNHLVAKPWMVTEASEAVLFRKIEAECPTLLMDEVDATFGKDSEVTQGLRAILNAGYRFDGAVARCVGPSHTPKDFNVFCPKAFAGIGDLPPTITDRCVPVELRRRGPAERRPERFHQRTSPPELTPIRDRCAEWAESFTQVLDEARPTLPPSLNDRAQDIWEPLLAIAELAGEEWTAQAHAAAVALSGAEEDDDLAIVLLRCCHDAFAAEAADAVPTARLLALLVARDDGTPFAGWWGKDVDDAKLKGPAARLARLLKPHGITPRQVWHRGANTRGYERASFESVWERYDIAPSGVDPKNHARTLETSSAAVFGQDGDLAKTAPDQETSDLASFFEETPLGSTFEVGRDDRQAPKKREL